MNLKIIKRKKLNEHETVYDIFVQFLVEKKSQLRIFAPFEQKFAKI